VHLKGANSMAMFGLISRSDLVGTEGAISILFAINGVKNKQSDFVGPAFKARSSAKAVGISSETYLGIC